MYCACCTWHICQIALHCQQYKNVLKDKGSIIKAEMSLDHLNGHQIPVILQLL